MIYTAHLQSSFGCELYSKSALLLILSVSLSHFNFAIYPRTGSTILPPFSSTSRLLHRDRKTTLDPRGSHHPVFLFYL